jgi:ABC-2 type transport system permease protein
LHKTWCIVKELYYLTQLFLRSLRFWGLFTYLLSIGFPLLMLIFLLFNIGLVDKNRMIYLFSATILVGFINISVTSLGQYLSNLKEADSLEIFRSLPINSTTFTISISLYYLIINIPTFVVFIIIMFLWGFRLFLNLHFFVTIFLAWMSLIPIGACIGLYAKGVQQGSVLSIATSFLLFMAAPVYFPKENLPELLQKLSYFIPTTYLAENMRAAINNNITPFSFWLNSLIIVLFSVLLYFLVFKRVRMVEN